MATTIFGVSTPPEATFAAELSVFAAPPVEEQALNSATDPIIAPSFIRMDLFDKDFTHAIVPDKLRGVKHSDLRL
ncbi:hypothetical protein GCM10009621_09010 [Corynebacterium felinum]